MKSESEPGAAASAAQLIAPPGMAEGPFQAYLRRTFASLLLRDYRLLLASNVITQFGSWFQNIGLTWLVYEVTGSPLAIGMLAAWRGFLSLFALPFGGVWADRFDRRLLVIYFTAISAIEGTLLAFLVYTGLITPGSALIDGLLLGTPLGYLVEVGATRAWVFFVFATIDGLVLSLGMPTRQAFVYDVAGHEYVTNAITLNASLGNVARVVGPPLAGYIIGFFGAHWAFSIRAGATWASLVFIIGIRPVFQAMAVGRRETTWGALVEGLRYVRGDRLMLGLIAAEVTLPFLIYPYIQFLPVFARQVLHGGPQTYGILASGVGIGAIPGGIFLASLGSFRWQGRLMLAAGFGYMGSVLLFTRSTHLFLSLAILIVAGFFWVMVSSLIQALIQLHVRPDVRARTVALYSMGNNVFQPVGALTMGAVVTDLGAQNGVAAFALTAMAALGAIALLSPQVRRA